MTRYTKKTEYIFTKWSNEKTIKSSEIKQTKLENQGYNLVKSWVEPNDVWVSKYEKSEVA